MPTSDASTDASTELATTCEGACRTTALTAMFGQTRVLDVAYYGIIKNASGTTIRVEAYRGAAPGCPEEMSPTPEITLILAMIPIPTTTAASTSSGTLLDFQGDLGVDPVVRATSVVLTPTAANVCESCVGMPAPSDPDGMIAIDASLVFEDGTIAGHFYATHCDSLDVLE